MSWVSDHRIYASNEITCDPRRDGWHREMVCEDCDSRRMAKLTLGDVEDRYCTGRLSQEDFEAYGYAYDFLSPIRGVPDAPVDPVVRRIARKLFALRRFNIPEELLGQGC